VREQRHVIEPEIGRRDHGDRIGADSRGDAMVGDRFEALEFNVYPTQWPIVVTDDIRGEARKGIDGLQERTGIAMTEQEVIESPHIFIGSISRFEEKFSELRERLGINSFLVGSLDELGPVVERLAGT